MKFGKVSNPEQVDFTMPEDHPTTQSIFNKAGGFNEKPAIYIGCAKWNKQDLKNFYPKGTKDELHYYSRQFNSIELNASFYRIFSPEQFRKWKDKTPENFKFFPKLPQDISHFKQLKDVDNILDIYLLSATELGEKLGTIFLQMRESFAPKYFDRLKNFIEKWPKDLDLTVELRHTDWYNDHTVANELYDLLESNNIGNTLVDTAGRRDMMHMRMTTPMPFVRWVGSNHISDYTRLDDWVDRIETWINQGMNELQFFVHQNMEEESPFLAAYLINKINERLGYSLKVPATLNSTSNEGLLFN